MKILKTDKRNRIALGVGAGGYYKVKKTKYGFKLERIVDVVIAGHTDTPPEEVDL